MHERLCVSGISSWNWSLEQDLAFYEEQGIHTIGLSLRKLDEAGGAREARDVLRRVQAAGLRVANLIGLGPFHLARPEQWPGQRDRVRSALETAAAVGAEALVMTTGPAAPLRWEDAAEALAEALGPAPDEARQAGVRLTLEHTNSLRVDVGFVHTLRDAIDLARRLDVAVCMEVNACWAERGLAATIADGIDRIGLVQVSDFAVGTHCTPDRRVPGDGDIPFERIMGDLLAAGYEGVFDLELAGPEIDREGYDSAITRSVDHLGTLLDALV